MERGEVRPEVVRRHPGEIVQQRQELRPAIGEVRAGQSGEDDALQLALPRRAHVAEARLCRTHRVGGIVVGGAGALQREHVIGDEIDDIEAQGRAAPHRPGKVGARPVDDRHEVVADGGDAVAAERGQQFLPGVNVVPPIGAARLDGIGHRDALDHRPAQPRRFDHRLALGDRRVAPRRAAGDLVQRRHDSGRTGLGDVSERDRVLGPVPSPGLFHLGVLP